MTWALGLLLHLSVKDFKGMKLLGLLTSADVKVSQERLVPYSRCYALQLNYKGHYPIPKYTDNFVIVFWGWGLGNALKTVGP